MKKILILLILISNKLLATTYYVSGSGNDSNLGISTGTSWQSIAKVNSFTFAANDIILFNKGDIFYGGIIVSRSNLSFGAYGTGANPIITGLSTITGWINLSGNIWEAPVTTVKPNVNLVLRNNFIQQIGRYPNAGSTNGGYLVISSGNTTSLTGPALSSTINWTGAEIVVKVVKWDIQRRTVTSHSAGVLGFAALDYSATANFGYFFQRDNRTLDVDGEWWYDNVNSKLRVYSTTTPSTYNYQIATVDTLFKNVYGTISLSNIDFNGSGTVAVYNSGGTLFSVTSCTVNNSGKAAILCNASDRTLVTGCTVKNSLGSGIRISTAFAGLKYLTATNNNVDSTCLIAGMEASDGVNGGAGILINGGDSVICMYNTVTNSGYNGIEWKGSQVHIKYNYVNNYCTVRSDGAGIYTVENGNNSLILPRNTRELINNICTNGIGNYLGTPDTYNNSCNGLYFDLGTKNVIVDSNTCAYNSSGAFHGNNNDSLWFRNNTFFNNNKTYSFQRFAGALPIRSIFINNNVLDKYRFEYRNLAIDSPTVVTRQSDILAMGTFSNNYYSLRSGTDTSLLATTDYYYGGHYITSADVFSYLTETVGIETFATNFLNTGVLYTNPTNTISTLNFTGYSKKDIYGNVYNNSATIPAWNSLILINNGTVANQTLIIINKKKYLR